MKSFVLFGILFLISGRLGNAQKSVGCYWGSWTSINQIDITLCTHAYFAFYTTDYNGVITTTSSTVSSFLALKSQNPSVKLLASIGGYNAGTAEFSTIATNPSRLSAFVSNCVSLAQNYDGIDLDWEYPEPYEQQLFINMLSALKSALNARGKILTIAVGAGAWRISQSYSIYGVCNNIDLLNLMSYDMQWPYTVTGTNTGYSIIDTAVTTWINGGCPANKIVLGLAAYGYNFNLVNPANNRINDASTGATAIAYRNICNKLKQPDWITVRYDQTPYSFNGNEWISYDDVTSLAAKLNIVNSRNLAGAFFWSTEQDDYDNSCGMGYYPLIRSVSRALGVISNPVTLTTTKVSTRAPTTVRTTTRASTSTTTSKGIVCSTDGFFAYPGDCNKFYRCFWGTPFIFSCPSGTGWNQNILVCDWKYNIPGCV